MLLEAIAEGETEANTRNKSCLVPSCRMNVLESSLARKYASTDWTWQHSPIFPSRKMPNYFRRRLGRYWGQGILGQRRGAAWFKGDGRPTPRWMPPRQTLKTANRPSHSLFGLIHLTIDASHLLGRPVGHGSDHSTSDRYRKRWVAAFKLLFVWESHNFWTKWTSSDKMTWLIPCLSQEQWMSYADNMRTSPAVIERSGMMISFGSRCILMLHSRYGNFKIVSELIIE